MRSAVFRCEVMHARMRPKRHRLRYRIFQVLLDLDEAEELAARSRLFSLGRANLFSFRPSDHLGGDRPLADQVRELLARAGLELRGGRIQVLCMPRVLGHAFNPLTLFFCHAADGGLAAILYEVNNTFGERHIYVAPVGGGQWRGAWVHQACDKAFFVSPFMPMELAYRFQVREPGETVGVRIGVSDAEGQVLTATLTGEREPFSDAALLRAALSAPLLGLKVLAAIHWEALRIWLKGVRPHRRDPARTLGVTVVRPTEAQALTPAGSP